VLMQRCLATLLVVGLVACGGGGGGGSATGTTPTGTTPETPSGPFDLLFTGIAVPHVGQYLSVVVVRQGAESVVESGSQVVATDGTFSFSWDGLLEGNESYHLDFYADHNGNGTCDPPPVDHTWRESLGPVTGPVTLNWQHTANFVDVCASWP